MVKVGILDKRRPLSISEIAALETQIASGDKDSMTKYASDIVDAGISDTSEIRRRQKILIDANHQGDGMVLRHIAMLSALVGDFHTAKAIADLLAEVGDPVIGYYIYVQLSARNMSVELLRNWEPLLQHSATAGYLPACRLLASKRAERFGPLAPVVRLALMVPIAVAAYKIAKKNPKDIRVIG